MDSHEQLKSDVAERRWFTTTHWSVVLAAQDDVSPQASQALASLCEIYWSPVHSYIHRTVSNPAEAEDLTQQFFARFLEKHHVRLAERDRGKFRTFLLTSVKNFLHNQQARAAAQKRGGGKQFVSLDEMTPDGERPIIEVADTQTADRVFEQTWAISLLAHARRRLQSEYEGGGKGDRFAMLERFLPGEESDLTYAQAAERLGVAEGTIKSDMHRLKKRYGEFLRDEIAQTVSTPSEVEEELQHLFRVFGGRAA